MCFPLQRIFTGNSALQYFKQHFDWFGNYTVLKYHVNENKYMVAGYLFSLPPLEA